jgi:hypothetical protein
MCKTAQFCATRRESEMAETPSVRNGVQAGENGRKNSLLNYKIAFTGFKTGDGVMGFVSHVGHEWVLHGSRAGGLWFWHIWWGSRQCSR